MPGERGPLKLKWILCCFSFFLITTLVACKRSGKIEILEERQGRLVFSNYTFSYEDMADPKIAELFKQEKLERFVHQHNRQWDRQVALCDWANAQFPPGKPDPYPLSNGLDILTDIRSGKTKGFCGQYAYLLGDALKSLGYFPVRYVELESKDHQFHFNVEVWNDDRQKWMILDPFYNVYFVGTKDGVPLSAMQIHDLLLQSKSNEIRIHPITERLYQPRAEQSLEFYHSFAISLRNDFAGFSAPVSVNDRLRMFLQYRDPQIRDWKSRLAYRQTSSRKEDFEYPCNQVWVDYEIDPASSLIHCRFETRGTMPHFRSFLVSVDKGDWNETGDRFEWKLRPGEHTLEVSAANQFHLSSAPALLRVQVPR